MIETQSVDAIIDGIIGREGRDYTHDPSDKGGPTKFGITLATLSEWRHAEVTAADVEALTEAEAREIYQHLYVLRPRFDLILAVAPVVGLEVIDTGVNIGQQRAARFLQRCLAALNREGRDYPDIAVDGRVGPATADALRAYATKRGAAGEQVLLEALNHLQGAFYIELAERDNSQERFLYGWLSQRASCHHGA